MSILAGICSKLSRLIDYIAYLFVAILLIYGFMSIISEYSSVFTALSSKNMTKLKLVNEETDEITLDDLIAINPDTIGWLTVPDTKIDYPFVQGVDNMEYVNKSIYGEFSLPGTIFLDCRNSENLADNYNLFYGHNMAYGAMFGDINKFLEQEYFLSHPTGTIYLNGTTIRLEFIACIVMDATDEIIFNPGNLKEKDMELLLQHIAGTAVQYKDSAAVTLQDRLVCLSTCSMDDTNGRIGLIGKLVE